MNNDYELAKQLAAKPYTLVIFREPTTDGEGDIFLAQNPELDGCKAQGLTMEEARDNLTDVRIEMIEHLLTHQLPIPSPQWGSNKTESDPLNIVAQSAQSDHAVLIKT